MRDDQRRLLDIAEAIERIDKYASKGREAFEGDELIQNWIVHHLQVIGEAARAISSELKDEHNEMPWQHIEGMRKFWSIATLRWTRNWSGLSSKTTCQF